MWIALTLAIGLFNPPDAPVAAPVLAGEIDDPAWAVVPSSSELARYYPDAAQRHEKVGVAVVRCMAKADGGLTSCALVCETPASYGFGKSALLLALHTFRLKPVADGGPAEGSIVVLPIHFNPTFLKPLPRCDRQPDAPTAAPNGG